jgi:hypothetical protein
METSATQDEEIIMTMLILSVGLRVVSGTTLTRMRVHGETMWNGQSLKGSEMT